MNAPRRISVVTGTRAEFGLLRPVIEAIEEHPDLELSLIVTGTHLLPPLHTVAEVERLFPVAARIEMQHSAEYGRGADAVALGRGVSGFAAHFCDNPPDVVLVLGDRIEAFAAAAAASVAGVRVAHMHGGDRGVGIADEALRHALSKLAHLHLPATARSAERLIAMGEEPLRTHLVGSPAIDGLDDVAPMPDDAYDALGRPEIVVLLHPTGRDDFTERRCAERLLEICQRHGRVLALHPNHDAGRRGIVQAIEQASFLTHREHLGRDTLLALLRRVRMIVGNSSAGLIECAAIPVRCINVGMRQSGRQMPPNVISCDRWDPEAIDRAVRRGLYEPMRPFRHPYGDGRTGERTANVLAQFDPVHHPLAKRNVY